jgi:hypothetical protein
MHGHYGGSKSRFPPLDVSHFRYGGVQLFSVSTSQMSEEQSPPGYLQQTLAITLRSPECVFAVSLNSLSCAPRDERNLLRSDNNTMASETTSAYAIFF